MYKLRSDSLILNEDDDDDAYVSTDRNSAIHEHSPDGAANCAFLRTGYPNEISHIEHAMASYGLGFVARGLDVLFCGTPLVSR